MRAIICKGFGGPEVLNLVRDFPKPTITKPTDVLIRVKASAVNRADIMQRKGLYPPPQGVTEVLGLEGAGIIEEVGTGVTRWKPGDRVMGLLSGGGHAEYTTVHEGHIVPIPTTFSFIQGAAIMEVFVTAWQCLRFHMNVKKGDYVLIHAGASGVGTAAAQLCERVIGAKAVTTSSEGKVSECLKYASYAVARTTDTESSTKFASKVQATVGVHSINAIIDPVFGGGYLEENVTVCAPGATITVLAMMGGTKFPSDYPASTMFKKHITLTFSTLRSREDSYKSALVRSFTEEAFPAFETIILEGSKLLEPVVYKVIDMADIQEAHRLLEGNNTIGKVVVKVDSEI